MKIIARRPVQVSGYGIVYKGQEIDLDPSLINERIAANFRAIDGSELGVSAAHKAEDKAAKDTEANESAMALKNCVTTLGREGIRRKLDDMGITYSPNAKTEFLAKLYLTQAGVLAAEEG